MSTTTAAASSEASNGLRSSGSPGLVQSPLMLQRIGMTMQWMGGQSSSGVSSSAMEMSSSHGFDEMGFGGGGGGMRNVVSPSPSSSSEGINPMNHATVRRNSNKRNDDFDVGPDYTSG
jgi:hypothetical protein